MICFITGGLISSLYDLKHKIIPNRITYPSFMLGLIEFFIISFAKNSYVIFGKALLFSVVSGLFFTILAYKNIFGFGDAKLSFLIGGLFTSFKALFISILLQLLISGIFVFIFIKKSEKIPAGIILMTVGVFSAFYFK